MNLKNMNLKQKTELEIIFRVIQGNRDLLTKNSQFHFFLMFSYFKPLRKGKKIQFSKPSENKKIKWIKFQNEGRCYRFPVSPLSAPMNQLYWSWCVARAFSDWLLHQLKMHRNPWSSQNGLYLKKKDVCVQWMAHLLKVARKHLIVIYCVKPRLFLYIAPSLRTPAQSLFCRPRSMEQASDVFLNNQD